jgi:hypothetical protein
MLAALVLVAHNGQLAEVGFPKDLDAWFAASTKHDSKFCR